MSGPAEPPDDGRAEPVRPVSASDVEARKVAELRASVVRLASEKIERAEAEAAAIRRAASEEASSSRRRAAQLMVTRLEEAAAAGVALRDTALADARQAREEACGIVETAVERVHELHDEIAGVMARVETLMGWLATLEDRLTTLQHQLTPDAETSADASQVVDPR